MKKQKLHDHYGLVLNAKTADELVSLNKEEVKKLVEEHGVLLFRSEVKINRESFMSITANFSNEFIVHGAKVRRKVSADGTVQTVTEGPGAIVLHSEMHFSPFAPDYMWFFCEKAPTQGGETTICDGEYFNEHLSKKAQSLLKSKKLKYWNLWDQDSWRKYFSNSSKEEIVEIFKEQNAMAWFNAKDELEFEVIKSAFTKTVRGGTAFVNSIAVHNQYHKNLKFFEMKDQESKVRHKICFEDGSEIPSWLFEELEAIERKLVFPLQWKDGDLILLDNNRMLHGRNAFDPAIERSILVRMTKAA